MRRCYLSGRPPRAFTCTGSDDCDDAWLSVATADAYARLCELVPLRTTQLPESMLYACAIVYVAMMRDDDTLRCRARHLAAIGLSVHVARRVLVLAAAFFPALHSTQ